MGLAWAEKEKKRIQVSALPPGSRCPLGTPATSQPSLQAGPDAVPEPPCRWGGQGTGAQAAGDRLRPARLPGSAQGPGGQRMRGGGTRAR